MVDCVIGSVQYKVLIDSGAIVNTVTPLVYESIKKNSWSAIQNVKLHYMETLKGYGSDKPIDVYCSFDFYIKAKKGNQPPVLTKFFVVNGTAVCHCQNHLSNLNLLRVGEDCNPIIFEYPKLNSVDVVDFEWTIVLHLNKS